MCIYPTLTKIAQDGGNPAYTSINLLRDELVSNAASVPSDLGDRLNEHLFLVVSEDEYSKATTELKPSAPANPTEPVPVSVRTSARTNPVNYDDVKEEFREFAAAKGKYSQYHNTSRCLVKNIITAVPIIYIEELSHPITKFGNIEPHTIIDHLQVNYGTVTALDLDDNDQRMRTPCSPPQLIGEMYRRLIEGNRFADEVGDTMEHPLIFNDEYTRFQNNSAPRLGILMTIIVLLVSEITMPYILVLRAYFATDVFIASFC